MSDPSIHSRGGESAVFHLRSGERAVLRLGIGESAVFHLRSGESVVFGYGSLCSMASMERTLGRLYEGPFVACTLVGWRRSWDIAMPNEVLFSETPSGRMFPEKILYLNVRPEPECVLNGVLFVVDTKELEAFDRREWIYDRVKVTDRMRGVTLIGGEAFTYAAKPEQVLRNVSSPREAAVRATYLDILEDAFRQWGEDFRRDYERSTDPVPGHLVIQDRRKE